MTLLRCATFFNAFFRTPDTLLLSRSSGFCYEHQHLVSSCSPSLPSKPHKTCQSPIKPISPLAPDKYRWYLKCWHVREARHGCCWIIPPSLLFPVCLLPPVLPIPFSCRLSPCLGSIRCKPSRTSGPALQPSSSSPICLDWICL